ncbi:hypothetical protein [Streptomyces californicus]|uniref:hypothetical protein n=1 Tax=Streptomyces californicus TaxID=67351 RepID=UPI00379B63A2
MLATAEHLYPEGPLGRVEIIWHRPANAATCDGDCDYHPIACGDPGISVPGGLRDVPDALSKPGQRWCTACRPDMTSEGVAPAATQAGERHTPQPLPTPTAGTAPGPLSPGGDPCRRDGTAGEGGGVSRDLLPAVCRAQPRTARPAMPFDDEMADINFAARIPEWARVSRLPPEYLTPRKPLARPVDGGTV